MKGVQTDPECLTIPVQSLESTRGDSAQGMGYADGALPMPFSAQMDTLLAQAERHVRIRAGFRVLQPSSVRIAAAGFFIEDTYFETNRIIARPLRKAETLAFFVATAGQGITAWSKDLFESDDLVQAYLVDALGSEIAERAAERIQKEIAERAETEGCRITNRYSPGYCNWSVAEQHKLFAFLPDNFCSITLTPSALMQPTKSVSGVIGVGANVQKLDYECKICLETHCYRHNIRHM